MTEKIIARGRGTGKTSELIRESARTGKYILVSNRSHGEALCNIAKKLGANIPYPVTIEELKRLDAYTCKSSIVRDGILVDEAIMVLEAWSGIKIKGATITIDDQDQPTFKVGEYYADDELELIYLITERNTKMAHVKVLDDKKMRHDLFHLCDIKGDQPATAEQIATFKRAEQFVKHGRKLDEFRVGDKAEVSGEIVTVDGFEDGFIVVDICGGSYYDPDYPGLTLIQTAEELQEVDNDTNV